MLNSGTVKVIIGGIGLFVAGVGVGCLFSEDSHKNVYEAIYQGIEENGKGIAEVIEMMKKDK